MKINFVSIGDKSLASHRFRVLKPYEILTKLGHSVTIKQFPDLDADVNVYQKHFMQELILKWMQNIKTASVFDVCDDYFDREYSGFYTKVCNLATVITCTNERMEKRLKSLFGGKPIGVVFDPINTIKGSPEEPRKDVIWFGHQTNFREAYPWLQTTVEAGYKLTVVTNLDLQVKGFTFIPYENGWVEENLKNYSTVLLPTGTQEWVNSKSENRFVDALNAGCRVITNNKILYKDLIPFGEYTQDNLKEVLAYPINANSILKGQEYINKKYNEEVLENQWKKVLKLI